MQRKTALVGELRHGILSVADALAQSVALLSLALGVAFASSAAAAETGIAAPFAYLIAGVGSLCLASVIIRFTRRMASAGRSPNLATASSTRSSRVSIGRSLRRGVRRSVTIGRWAIAGSSCRRDSSNTSSTGPRTRATSSSSTLVRRRQPFDGAA